LVLTFTRALATELRRVGLRSVFPIRDFARDEARRRGLVCADDAEVLTWKTPSWETMLRAVIDALSEASEPIWDVVLVDEAQDLGDLDWALVDVLVTAGAALWLFGDENQRALRHAQNAEIPERLREAGVFRLRAGLRSPPDLLDLATRVLHDDVPPTEAVGQQGGDEALAFVRLDEASDAATTDALERVVRGLLAQEGVRLDDIMVISLGSAQRSRLASWSTLAGHPSRPADDSGVEPSLVADTVMRLKGLERPHVIVVDTDLGASDPRAWRRAMYLAMTRASASCVIVTTLAALRSTVLTERMRANGG
jgi:superfamily I DNA/RNA helicase